MSEITLHLTSNDIVLDEIARLSISVSYSHPLPLRNLRMRLQAGPGLQILGSPQLQISDLPARDTKLYSEIRVIGKKTGAVELGFDRISAVCGGNVLHFDPITLVLQVVPKTIHLDDVLRLISETPAITAGRIGEIRLRLRNITAQPVEVALSLSDLPPGTQAELEAFPDLILQPGEEQRVPARIFTSEPGKYRFSVICSVKSSDTALHESISMEIPVYAAKDAFPGIVQKGDEIHIYQTNIQTGDIIQINRNSDNVKMSLSCPACGRESLSGRAYCDNCGRPLAQTPTTP